MPSDRKQINVRVDGETELLIERLRAAARAKLGLAVSQSDVFRLALAALAEKYLTDPAEDTPPTRAKRARRG